MYDLVGVKLSIVCRGLKSFLNNKRIILNEILLRLILCVCIYIWQKNSFNITCSPLGHFSVAKWEDPFDSTIYCVKSDGQNAFVSGTARHGLVRLWDKRMIAPVQVKGNGFLNLIIITPRIVTFSVIVKQIKLLIVCLHPRCSLPYFLLFFFLFPPAGVKIHPMHSSAYQTQGSSSVFSFHLIFSIIINPFSRVSEPPNFFMVHTSLLHVLANLIRLHGSPMPPSVHQSVRVGNFMKEIYVLQRLCYH